MIRAEGSSVSRRSSSIFQLVSVRFSRFELQPKQSNFGATLSPPRAAYIIFLQGNAVAVPLPRSSVSRCAVIRDVISEIYTVTRARETRAVNRYAKVKSTQYSILQFSPIQSSTVQYRTVHYIVGILWETLVMDCLFTFGVASWACERNIRWPGRGPLLHRACLAVTCAAVLASIRKAREKIIYPEGTTKRTGILRHRIESDHSKSVSCAG